MTFLEAATIALLSLASYYVWGTSEAAASGPLKYFTLTEEIPETYIESPNYPNDDYPNNTLIVYRVEVKLNSKLEEEQARIEVTFEVFLMEKSPFCDKDGLDLFDSTGKVRSYCGPQSGSNFLIEDRSFAMRMRTDMTGRDRGFRIHVKLYQMQCGGIIKYFISGFITSPEYPSRYPSHTLCVWRLETARNWRIMLKFSGKFDIRSNNRDTCFMDYVDISRTGSFSTDSHRYCGKTRPRPVVSMTPSVLVKFVSDCCNEGSGFRLDFMVVRASAVDLSEATDRYNPISCQSAKCGPPESRQFPDPYLFGVGQYYPHKYPWMVAIFDYRSQYLCAGSLISQRHILTAAHCCINQRLLQVKIAVHALNEQWFLVAEQCVMHPAYTKDGLVNDIAVIVLSKHIYYNAHQWPICLPIDAEDIPGLNGTIAGWSRVKYDGRHIQQTPHEDTVIITSHSSCVYELGALSFPTNICAWGGTAGGCQGENGGPLMSTEHLPRKFVQVGIVTKGIGCGRNGHLGIYTRITPYHDFVYNITGEQWCSVRPPK